PADCDAIMEQQEDIMHTKRLEQIGASAGLVFLLLALAYIFLSPQMEPTAGPSEVAKVYTDQQFGALFWNWVGSLAFFCYLFFLGALYSVLRRAERGTGWLSLIAFSGGALFIAIHGLMATFREAFPMHDRIWCGITPGMHISFVTTPTTTLVDLLADLC